MVNCFTNVFYESIMFCFVVATSDPVYDREAIYIAYVSFKQHLEIFSEI